MITDKFSMKNITTIILCLFCFNLIAADLSFIKDFAEIVKISQNGIFGSSTSSCSSCSGFAEIKCPKYAEDLISDHVEYGILGFFNNEKKYHSCFKNKFRPEALDLNRLGDIVKMNAKQISMPSSSSYDKCFEEYGINKKDKPNLLFALNAYHSYAMLNVAHHKNVIWKKVQAIDALPDAKSKMNATKRAQLDEQYHDLVAMDSCFTSDINCWGAKGTYKRVPKYTPSEILADFKVSDEIKDTFSSYLEAAYCIEK